MYSYCFYEGCFPPPRDLMNEEIWRTIIACFLYPEVSLMDVLEDYQYWWVQGEILSAAIYHIRALSVINGIVNSSLLTTKWKHTSTVAKFLSINVDFFIDTYVTI